MTDKQPAVKPNTSLRIDRINNGTPLIRASESGWDNWFTLNPTAWYLERSEKNDPIIAGLVKPVGLDDPLIGDGVVAVMYRGVCKDAAGKPSLRSASGLAVFTPDLRLIKRFEQPVVRPEEDPEGFDYNGVEDQRITRIGDMFYLAYCGWVVLPDGTTHVRVCLAESKNLIEWKKLGPAKGDINDHPNKDAVLFPEPYDGKYYMLHRPCVGKQGEFSIRIAESDSPTGEWTDLGVVIGPWCAPRYTESWIGGGSCPISLGNGRYLFDYHTGNYYANGERDYFANFGTLDLAKLKSGGPSSIVESRLEEVVFPSTEFERNSPWPHTTALHCVFPCGSYEFKGDIYLIYGGADAYVCAAKTDRHALLAALGHNSASQIG